MTTASSDQTTYSAFTSRIQQAFLSCRPSAQLILLVFVLQRRPGSVSYSTILVVRMRRISRNHHNCGSGRLHPVAAVQYPELVGAIWSAQSCIQFNDPTCRRIYWSDGY